MYVLNNIDKCVKLINTTWEMENVWIKRERANKTRMQILQDCLDTDCVPNCHEQWYALAKATLERNSIEATAFASAIRVLLKRGRGKHRNILLTGPTNCGKSFLLTPIMRVFRTFANPAQSSFAWIGVEKAEAIFLNDIRWTDKLIPWNNFLQILEDAEVRLSVPKNHCPEDIRFTRDTPIFATSIGTIRKYTAGVVNEMETQMMDSRWKVFKFTVQLQESDIIELEPCTHCFAKLVFDHSS